MYFTETTTSPTETDTKDRDVLSHRLYLIRVFSTCCQGVFQHVGANSVGLRCRLNHFWILCFLKTVPRATFRWAMVLSLEYISVNFQHASRYYFPPGWRTRPRFRGRPLCSGPGTPQRNSYRSLQQVHTRTPTLLIHWCLPPLSSLRYRGKPVRPVPRERQTFGTPPCLICKGPRCAYHPVRAVLSPHAFHCGED